VRARAAAEYFRSEISALDEQGKTLTRLLSLIHTCRLADEIAQQSAAVMLHDFVSQRVKPAAEAEPLLQQVYAATIEEVIATTHGRATPDADLQHRPTRRQHGVAPESEHRRPVHVRMSRARDRLEVRIVYDGRARRFPISISHAYSLLQEVETSLAELRSLDGRSEPNETTGIPVP